MNEDSYMATFKEKSLKEKQKIVVEQLKLLSGFTNNLCQKMNKPNKILLNRELLDIDKEEYTEDDFAEAIIVLINSIQGSICDYSITVSNILKQLGY